MNTYEITFTGRRVGAIGVFEKLRTRVFGDNEEAAVLALYGRFEHIQQPEIKKVESPFDFNGLVERVQNTEPEHKAVRRAVQLLRYELDQVARHQAEANADWHDDQDSEDYGLYHSPMGQQFPREERDKAILELVSRHLEVLNENESGKAVAA